MFCCCGCLNTCWTNNEVADDLRPRDSHNLLFLTANSAPLLHCKRVMNNRHELNVYGKRSGNEHGISKSISLISNACYMIGIKLVIIKSQTHHPPDSAAGIPPASQFDGWRWKHATDQQFASLKRRSTFRDVSGLSKWPKTSWIVIQCLRPEYGSRRHWWYAWWRHFPRCWPYARRIHRSPVNSPHKGEGRGALMFPLIIA